MKKFLVKTAVALLRFINLFFSGRKLKEQIAIISRQADELTLDLRILKEELDRRGITTLVLTRKMEGSLLHMIGYVFHMIKQMSVLSRSKLVVLDGYCIAVSALPHREGQKVVQIWHAMGAVKKFGWQSVDKPDGRSPLVAQALCMHRNYDYVMAPCRLTGEFFTEAFGCSSDRIFYCALPRVDYLKSDAADIRKKISDKYPQIKEKTNVLYVPTFRRNAALSLEPLVDAFDFSRFNLIVKKHFLDTADYSWAEQRGAIVDTDFSSMDWLRICPKAVTDYSAIAFEAAAIDRELYIYQPDCEKYEENTGMNMRLETEALAPYFCRNEKELVEALEMEYDPNAISAFRDKYLETDLTDCTGHLCDFLISLVY